MLCQTRVKRLTSTKFHKGCTWYIGTMSWRLTWWIWMDILGCHGGSTSFGQWGNCCCKVWFPLSSTCTPADLPSAIMPGQKGLISANFILISRRHTWLISQNIWKSYTVSHYFALLPNGHWYSIWQLRQRILSVLWLDLTIWMMICPLNPITRMSQLRRLTFLSHPQLVPKQQERPKRKRQQSES